MISERVKSVSSEKREYIVFLLISNNSASWGILISFLAIAAFNSSIFIDLPPSLGVLTVNALVASDSVLIPIQAEYYALEGVADLINTIQLVEKRLRSPTPIKGILLTLYDKRTRLSRDVHKELKKYFGESNLLFKTIIPRNIRLAEAPSFGKPCLIYDPDSTGTKAYLKLAKEILKRDEEALNG